MTAVPSGTVTFLFTDVVDSTRQWERDAGVMSDQLADHDRVLRATIEAHDGYVFATGGDGFAASFADAVPAVMAAIEAQTGSGLAVRMGLHTGTAEERDNNYFGRTLNRAARIMAAGYGGQILLSDATAALVRDEVRLMDLGEHRLAGLDSPIHVWQVGVEAFPSLHSASVAAGNLPQSLDSFVGRTLELIRLSEMMTTCRLVSVVGVGGMGKTRLAIEAGHRMNAEVPDGVWLIDLALARSDNAVAEQVASSLAVRPAQGQSTEDRLVEYLANRSAVLVVDNCEHVMHSAAAMIERLLRECPALRVVATSREAMMVHGEHVMPLGPLATEVPGAGRGIESGVGEAVMLFIDRVRAVQGSFDPDQDERAGVIEICRRLDGMPLAIELAAARTGSLGVAGVLDRLGDRLRLLTGGWRTRVERHQTLQATVDWSYELLSQHERSVFDRLGVFVGWFELDDAIAVVGDEQLLEYDVIDALSGLVDKSMCVFDPASSPARYRYLETMKAYARDRLQHACSLAQWRTRHASRFAGLAVEASDVLVGPEEVEAAASVERAAPDLRAALLWAADQRLDEVIDDILSAGGSLWMRGWFELHSWAYDLRHDLPDHLGIQLAAQTYAFFKGDFVESARLGQHVLDAGHSELSPYSWANLGWVAFSAGDVEGAIRCQERYYEHIERSDRKIDHVCGAFTLAVTLGIAGRDAGELPRQIIERATAVGWRSGIALGWYAEAVASEATDPVHGLDAYNRAFEIGTEVGCQTIAMAARRDRLNLQTRLLAPAQLSAELTALLRYLQQAGDTFATINALSRSAELLHGAAFADAAARIHGWLDGRSNRTVDAAKVFAARMAAVESETGDRWRQLVAEGRSMSVDEIIDRTCGDLAGIT